MNRPKTHANPRFPDQEKKRERKREGEKEERRRKRGALNRSMSPPPNYEFQEWWNKEREKNAASFLDNPNPNPTWSAAAEIRSPGPDRNVDKSRARSVRQLSWVCILRLQQAAAGLLWLANGLFHLLSSARRRVTSSSADRWSDSRLYRLIKAFSVLALVLLLFELAAYSKGWHFSPPSHASAEDLVEFVYANWLFVRANYLAPPLQALADVCIVLFMVQTVDRMVLLLGCFWIKFRRLKPVPMAEIVGGDVEKGDVMDYPMVLLQIPMCNEREVRRCRFLIPALLLLISI